MNKFLVIFIIPLTIFLSLIVGWELLCMFNEIPIFILPSPSAILKTIAEKHNLLAYHAAITSIEILGGIILALSVAIPLSILMFAKPTIDRALAIFLVASQAIPVFALAPLLIIWLGYGLASKIFMAAIIIFFPITVSLLQGLKSCDAEYRMLFKLMGADFFTTLRILYWPWALPYFFSGLKVGVTVATIGAVIGEWVGAQRGLGFLMIQANARLQTDLVFAAIFYLTGMGLLLWGAVNILEKRCLKWKIIN
ncbi:MAG: ABC transporter permease [Desulfotalea sp.]